MRICIYGAGAVGGLIGGELARAGHDVTLIGRGANLAAIRADGLRLRIDGEERLTRPACAGDPQDAGTQDLVIFALKAHHVADAADRLAPLLGPDTPVVAAQNGIPWWYFHGTGGRFEGRSLTAVDAERRAWSGIGPERTVGAVVNGSCTVIAPGVVVHTQPSRSLTIGEPDGTASARCAMIAEAFAATDIDAPISRDIRRELWTKLLHNLAVSQICVLTRSNLAEATADAGCRALSRRLMEEAASVAAGHGVGLADTVARFVEAPLLASTHKPSTLQDLEAGRPMEIDSMVGAVCEMGRMADRPTPFIDALYALLRRLAESTGTYPPNPGFAPDPG